MATFQPSIGGRETSLPVPLAAGVLVSIGIHLLFLLIFLFATDHAARQRGYSAPGVIDVDLVSFPAPAAAKGRTNASPSLRQPAEPKVKQPSKKTLKKTERKVSVFSSGKRMEKVDSKKAKGVDAEKLLSSAIKEIAGKVEAGERGKASGNNTRDSEYSDVRSGGGPAAGTGGIDPIALYNQELKIRIWRNWVCPEGAEDSLKTVLAVHIGSDGSILSLRLEEGSGNAAYDESARRAVLKSAPFSPLPKGVAVHKVILEFTPGDSGE